MKAAVQGLEVEPWLPAITPGTVEHWLWNEHYKSDEEFLFAIADVMHEEYKLIADAGLVLQVDDPDLPDGWQMYWFSFRLSMRRLPALVRVGSVSNYHARAHENFVRTPAPCSVGPIAQTR